MGVASACIPLLLKRGSHDPYAPLLNQIGSLEAYLNLLKLDMSSRAAGPLNVIYNFESASNMGIDI